MIPEAVYKETISHFLGPVRDYLEDPSVNEVMINGPDCVYIERRGRIEPTPARFDGSDAVMCALRNIAQFVGKEVDERHPILEARLPDGSRVQAVIAPAAPTGPYVAIRKFARDTMTLERLVELDAMTPLAAEFLRIAVRAKLNIIVAGGTGSGKTSLLNILAALVPENERVVVLEDSREIQVNRSHVVYLESRPPDTEGDGEITIRSLFRATLRMRPDRIIIGEIRGGEALDIVQAMVSGHGGCLGTLHATYPRDTLTRLETMAMMSDIEMPLLPLRLQIASGVNLIVQVSRLNDGSRKVTHVTEVVRFDQAAQSYVCQDLLYRRFEGTGSEGRIVSTLIPTKASPGFAHQLLQHGLEMPDDMHPSESEGPNHVP
jgi:pilus assembly protein CpaF